MNQSFPCPEECRDCLHLLLIGIPDRAFSGKIFELKNCLIEKFLTRSTRQVWQSNTGHLDLNFDTALNVKLIVKHKNSVIPALKTLAVVCQFK